jgi:type IV pilus assembly protein PilP
MMEKFPVIIRYLICTSCILLFLGGCDGSAGTPAGPKVVRKKIVTPQKKAVTVRKVRTNRIAKAAPASGAQQPGTTGKRIVTAKTRQTAAGTKPMSAKKAKAKVPARPKAAAAPAKINKPATHVQASPVSPPASTQKKPVSSSGTAQQKPVPASGNKLLASTPKLGLKLSPDGSPPPYDPTGKLDPFEPLFKEKPVIAKKSKRKKRIPRTPLERIDLSQLKLVGIILAASGNRAMVEESSGKGYIIKKGTFVGTNAGKVVQIKKDKVIVEEEFEDVFGKTKTRKRELKLPKPPGEL